ncbi:PLP-dependent transferase [Laetiporus sulphureus 93-53]|uniref:PLP-dependent transferase n=1 Tax=Laetiporus sulphureus 93-53 TaxID=1314785 RepID=A0A165C884_9APHY|nr:PLP-dependent transferase [Laetiporus sulphureus 93-53]KZT02371.1 PLP-dependent transferase [Laetiporus sulphureus 93-53]
MSSLAFRLSRGIENTSCPPIPQAYKWAAEYVPTPGRPLLDMSQGVPGTPPPKPVLDALATASSDPASCGYVPNVGELSLRKAVVEEMKHGYGEDTDVTPDDIAITAGCNLAFVAVAMTLADAGDEIILPIPWYFNHEMTLTTLNIKPVILPTRSEEGFMPSPERCASLITPKTKAIILVSPNNPTGAVYSPARIYEFAQLARKHNVALVIDETYRDFITTGVPHFLFQHTPNWDWRTTFIHLYSFSKAYCIPGHRLGMLCASPVLIPHICTALDSLQICAPRPPQLALAPLLPTLRPFVQETAHAIAHRHTLFRAVLPKNWKIGSQGGYYAFVRHPFVGMDSTDVCKRLAREMGVVCLPATFFEPKREPGAELERWIRFSVANVNDEKVKLVCERLAESENVFGWKVDSLS